MSKYNTAKELVEVIEQIEQLKKKEQGLRQELLKIFNKNESLDIGQYVVTKKVVKETITDPTLLRQLGIDPDRATVTVTKIDPTLVRTIGEKEGKKYYNEIDKIIVTRKEVKK